MAKYGVCFNIIMNTRSLLSLTKLGQVCRISANERFTPLKYFPSEQKVSHRTQEQNTK